VLLSPAGRWAPDLWLVCARAGVVLAVVLAYHLARRLRGRLAGIVAAVGLLTAYQVVGYLTFQGMSEPLCAAFVLAAVDAHLAGRRRAVLGLLFLAGLVRIEIWPFLALYGVVFVLRGARRPVRTAVGLAGLLVLLPLLWLVPDLLSAGNLLRSASRATYESQGGPLVSHYPGLATINEGAGILFWPLTVGFVGETIVGLAVWWRARRVRTSLVFAVVAWAWLLLEAVMGQLRIATGAPRYLLPGVALAAVAAGCAWSELADAAGPWVATRRTARTARTARAARTGSDPAATTTNSGATTATGSPARLTLRRRSWPSVAVVVLLLGCSAPSLVSWGSALGDDRSSAAEVESLAHELPAAIHELGGRHAILACGPVSASNLQNPAVAWALHIHLGQVGIFPDAHGVVLQWDSLPPIPVQYLGDYRLVGQVGPPDARWTLLSTCGPTG
jgi:4-amino-4-deoxy-L-arabinose transferase-like glycosyltransferase